MAPRYVTTGSSWVEPAGPVVAKTITCSAVENQCAQVYPTCNWLFAHNKDMKDPITHYEMLKKGLARMLYEQPICGGTLTADDRGAYSVEIAPAPRTGARFYYRDLSNDSSFPTFAELEAENFPIMDLKHDGLSAINTEDFPHSQAGEATFLAQFVVLRGGIIVTGSWTHLIGDLLQPRVAAVSWARETKLLWEAQLAGLPEPALPMPLPDALFDRTRLLPQVAELKDFEEIKAECDKRGNLFMFDPTDPEGTAELMTKMFPAAHLKPNEVKHESKLRKEQGGYLLMPLSKLKALQQIVQAGAPEKLSAVNVIIAFLWQRVYIARYGLTGKDGLSADKLTHPSIVFPGDVRSRLNPPLPPNFLGAAVDLFMCSGPSVQEFLPENNSTAALSRSLAKAAMAVKNTGSDWKEDSYIDLLKLFQAAPVSVPYMPKGPLEFLITDHSRNQPMRLCDFGHGLGVATNYRQPYAGRDLPQGEVTILPRHANGDIELMITGETITMQRLFSDPVVLQFATPLFLSHNAVERVHEKRAAKKASPSARL